MEFSPACFSTRSIGFNPFCVPQLALSLAYPIGLAFRTPCTTNYTGSPSHAESVEFKLCSVVYKCIHDSASRYLSQYCIPVASLPGRSHLRPAASGDLFVPATSTKTIGPRGFFHAGQTAWNCLSPSLKDPNVLGMTLNTSVVVLSTTLNSCGNEIVSVAAICATHS